MKYILTEDRFNHRAGTIVYDARVPDHGLASSTSLFMRDTYVSVTEDPSGGYPLFSVAIKNLQVIGVTN